MELLRGDRDVVRVGHRGAAALAPENSLEAIEAAVAHGVDVVELDVVAGATADLVLAHGPASPAGAPRARRRPRARREARRRGAGRREAAGPRARTSSRRSAATGLLDRSFVSSFSLPILRRFAALEPALPRSLTYPEDRHGVSERPLARAVRAPVARRAPHARPGAAPRAGFELRRARGDAQRRRRLAACGRGLPSARRRRLRLDGRRACARNYPGRNRYRRYHHERSTDPSAAAPSQPMKRLLSFLIVLLAAGAFASACSRTTRRRPRRDDDADHDDHDDDDAHTGARAARRDARRRLDRRPRCRHRRAGRARLVRRARSRSASSRRRSRSTPSLFALSVPIDSAIARALTVAPNTPLALRATFDRRSCAGFVAKLAKRFDRKPVASRLLLRALKPS